MKTPQRITRREFAQSAAVAAGLGAAIGGMPELASAAQQSQAGAVRPDVLKS